jgi:hypothetical protein
MHNRAPGLRGWKEFIVFRGISQTFPLEHIRIGKGKKELCGEKKRQFVFCNRKDPFILDISRQSLSVFNYFQGQKLSQPYYLVKNHCEIFRDSRSMKFLVSKLSSLLDIFSLQALSTEH